METKIPAGEYAGDTVQEAFEQYLKELGGYAALGVQTAHNTFEDMVVRTSNRRGRYSVSVYQTTCEGYLDPELGWQNDDAPTKRVSHFYWDPRTNALYCTLPLRQIKRRLKAEDEVRAYAASAAAIDDPDMRRLLEEEIQIILNRLPRYRARTLANKLGIEWSPPAA